MLYRNPRSSFWWSDFAVAGKRYRRSTGETDRQLAALKETELIAAVVADVSGDRLDLPGVQSHVEYRNRVAAIAMEARQGGDGHAVQE